MHGRLLAITGTLCLLISSTCLAGGGPLGIDHRWNVDDSGIWKRSIQNDLMVGLIATEVVGALYEGSDTRIGKTYWQSIDSSATGAVASLTLKHVFSRSRPSQTDNPNEWFKGSGHESFPSGEVTAVTSIITPFVLEYGHDHPMIYALQLLPAYDAIARMKSRGHWQSDVIAGFALGTATGFLAHSRPSPLLLSVLPDGFAVGFKKRF
jgi:acid phosphatase family membrane protein YuiD